jgi:hypothetical protein
MGEDYLYLENKLKGIERRLITLEKGKAATHKEASKKQKRISIKEYIIKHAPENDVQRTLVIAGYLEKEKDYSSFNIDDIKQGFRQARIPQPSNANDKVNMNISKGYLMEDEAKKDNKKAWVLTVTGESAVENNFGEAES